MPVRGSLSVWEAERDEPLLEMTLGDMLDRQAARLPAREAVRFPAEGVRWTFAGLRERAERLARGLLALGLSAGERVAVCAPGGPDWVLLEHALARAGCVLVTVNTASHAGELRHVLHQGRVSALFTARAWRGNDLLAALEGARAEGLPHLRDVVLLDGTVPGEGAPGGSAAAGGMRTLAGVMAAGAGVTEAALRARAAAVRPGDVAQIQYTSGTTGLPKGVMLTHRGILNNAHLMAARAGFGEDTRLLGVMPLFHTAGCVCNVLGMLAAGGCYVGLAAFDAAEALRVIVAERITAMNGVPTLYLRLLAEPGVREGCHRAASTLRTCFAGGTDIPAAMLEAMRDAFGAEPMVIMGMTECSPLITQTVPAHGFARNSTTAGVPLPYTEVQVVDAAGEAVPLGQPGELLVRGYGVTPGYFDMPERTHEAIDAAGWLHSGDLATLDADGTLRVVGRTKDMVIRGGENLYPAEIEAMLMTHPGVEQAQVVGVPDAQMGEELFAFVVPRAGAALDPQALREWARERISRHKVPRHVALLDAFPQTGSGKVRKVELRAMARGMVG